MQKKHAFFTHLTCESTTNWWWLQPMDLWSQFLVVKTNKSWNHKRIQYAKDHKKNSVINVTTSAKVFRRSQQIFVEIFRITCLWSEVLKQSLNRVWYYAPKVGLRSTYLYKESWNESRIVFWFLCVHHDRLKLRCNLYIKHDAKWCIFTWFTVAVKHENTKKNNKENTFGWNKYLPNNSKCICEINSSRKKQKKQRHAAGFSIVGINGTEKPQLGILLIHLGLKSKNR